MDQDLSKPVYLDSKAFETETILPICQWERKLVSRIWGGSDTGMAV